MANELGRAKAAIVKALLEAGRSGQEISMYFEVNSRAVSQIKNGDEYSDVSPDHSHNIPDEIFAMSKMDILNQLGGKKIKKIAARKYEMHLEYMLKDVDLSKEKCGQF